jgi:sugar phosphate isomerase/epimerase
LKIGYCAPLEKADVLKAIGYDFIEPKLMSYPLEDQQSLDNAKTAVSRSSLPILAFCAFFPYDMRLVGPEVDQDHLKSYLARAAGLTNAAGAEVAVMGSAWSRNVPENWERSRAEDQLLQAYSWAADAFEGTGVVIGIEPQNRKEANIITNLTEAVGYAKAVNRDEIKVMADFYHMDEESEPLETLRTFSDWIVHVQLADTGRQNPGTGSYDYDTFFRHLKECGYTGHISVELMHEIPESEMRRSLEFLRNYWPSAQGPGVAT